MNRLFRILPLVLTVLLVSCTNQGLDYLPEVLTDEIPVNLSVVVAPLVDEEGTTRSYVTGEDTPNITASTPVKLLCFDLTGLFVASRDGTLIPTDNDSGKLSATVPNNTARIHFLFNYPSGMSVAPASEAALMQHINMTVGITDDMSYWGYHRETTTGAMAAWLNGNNTLKLLRDRAQLNVENDDPSNISSIIWTVSDGLNRGLMAPLATGSTNSYPNSYDSDANTQVTQFREGGSYTLTAPDSWNATTYKAAGWTSESEPQYLMENRNVRYPIKVVLRVTFTNSTVKYFAMKMLDATFIPISVKRNHKYTLKVHNLTADKGHDTAAEALAAVNYGNDAFASVGSEVTEIDNGAYKLFLGSPYLMYNASGATTQSIDFTYINSTTGDGVGAGGEVPGSFAAVWMDKEQTDSSPEAANDISVTPTVTYNTTSGAGSIQFVSAPVNNVLKHSIIRLISTDSGLYRDIDIYSIAYTFSPTLTQVGSTTNYQLTFSLPSGLPEEFFPFDVRLTSWTLQPTSLYYDNTDSTKKARVTIGSTNVSPITNGNAQTWNYNATTWNRWFDYPIDYQNPAPTNYVINLKDIRGDMDNNTKPNGVGVYVQLVGFSDLLPLTP